MTLLFRRLFFSLFFALPFFTFAQETIVRDANVKPPFRGELRYKLSYKGAGFEDLKEGLPDSLIIVCSERGFAAKYFGGMSDSLLNWMVWDRKTGKMIFFYPLLEQAFEAMPSTKDTLKPKLKTDTQTTKILGKNCRKITVTWNNKEWKDEFWVWEKEIFDGLKDTLSKSTLSPIFFPGIKGIPYRHIRHSLEGKAIAEIKEVIRMPDPVTLPSLPEGQLLTPLPKGLHQEHPAWKKLEYKPNSGSK